MRPVHFSGSAAVSAQSSVESSSLRRGVTDVFDEHALVEHDVEVVDPDREAEVDVLAARDLVLLVPRAEFVARATAGIR